MTAKPVPSSAEVVGHLLHRFKFTSYTDLQAAMAVLTRCVLQSMQAPAAYALPLEQKLPDEMGPEGAFTTVHPQNVATALISIAVSGERMGGENLAIDPSLQLWIGDWTFFNELAWAPVPITVVVAAAPAPAPAPAIPPGPAGPPPAPVANSVMDLVNAALADGPAVPVVEDPAITAPAPPPPPYSGPPAPPAVAAVPAPPVAPTTVAATPTVVTAPPPPKPTANVVPIARAPGTNTVPEGDHEMPDASVILQRTGNSGRPQASPFTKKVEPRTKIGEPPFWWGFFIHSAERILTQHPAQALDPDSQGSGPVQAYTLLLHILHDKVLSGVDPYITVAGLRSYLREVIANIEGLPNATAINQLADSLLGEDSQEDAANE